MEENKKQSNKKGYLVFISINLILACFLGALFGFFSSEIRTYLNSVLNRNLNDVSSEIVKERIIQEDSAVIEVVEKTSPAVVSIIVSKEISTNQNIFSDPFSSDFFKYFFGQENQTEDKSNPDDNNKTVIGGGSGFLVTSDGLVVTNKHVVEDASADYSVMTNDGEKHSASIVATDPVNDVAILKIEGENYPTLPFGNSDDLKVGQTVIAIGNSLGEFSNSVSRGIVSGLKRSVTAGNGIGQSETLTGIIQTDAAINVGNSGGPLLNISGEVVGINVAMATSAENVGFAIPINQLKRSIDQVRETGKISTPYLGIRYVPLDKTIQKENNLPYSQGILVVRGSKMTDLAVIPSSPADKAGIVEGDIILELNGEKITDQSPLINLLSQYTAGEEITLKLWHKGEEKQVKVILEERN